MGALVLTHSEGGCQGRSVFWLVVAQSFSDLWRAATREAGHALRSNWLPFCLIQGSVITFVVVYYNNVSVQGAMVGLGELRERYGYLFAALAGAFCGGVIPEIAKLLTGRLGKIDSAWAAKVGYTLVVYALNTILVAFFYQVMAWTVGTGTDLRTVATKVVFDQFVFTPFISIPFSLVAFAWFEGRFRSAHLAAFVKRDAFLRRYMPTMLVAWSLWIPAVSAVYSLPIPLQLPVSLGVLGAWSLLLVFMSLKPAGESVGLNSQALGEDFESVAVKGRTLK